MREKGFTLIELMTAVTIFTVVMTISMGSILAVFNANRKSETLKSVMDNLNLSVESMSREIRFGTSYHCGISGGTSGTNDCAQGDTAMAFLSKATPIIYRLNGTTIEKSIDGAQFLPVTAPEIIVSNLSFFVLGSATGDSLQPKVLIRIIGSAKLKDTDQSNFTLETLVSQRLLDKP